MLHLTLPIRLQVHLRHHLRHLNSHTLLTPLRRRASRALRAQHQNHHENDHTDHHRNGQKNANDPTLRRAQLARRPRAQEGLAVRIHHAALAPLTSLRARRSSAVHVRLVLAHETVVARVLLSVRRRDHEHIRHLHVHERLPRGAERLREGRQEGRRPAVLRPQLALARPSVHEGGGVEGGGGEELAPHAHALRRDVQRGGERTQRVVDGLLLQVERGGRRLAEREGEVEEDAARRGEGVGELERRAVRLDELGRLASASIIVPPADAVSIALDSE